MKTIITIVFITDSWSISQTKSYNTRAQKMDSHTVAHYRIGVCTRPTLRGSKHFHIFAPKLMQAVRAKTAGLHMALCGNFSGPVS